MIPYRDIYSKYGPFDVLVFRDGPYAVAIDRKGRLIAKDTDHASVIQEAINFLAEKKPPGGLIFIGSGIYYIYKTIKVISPSVTIMGAGTIGTEADKGTVLKLADDANCDIIEVPYPSYKVRITNLVIDGNKSKQTKSGIRGVYYHAGAPEDAHIDNIYIVNVKGPPLVIEGWHGFITNVWVEDSDDYVYIKGNRYSIIALNVYDSYGIWVEAGAKHNRLIGCYIWRTHETGIVVRGERNIVKGCIVDEAYGNGIILWGAHRSSVIGCIVYAPSLAENNVSYGIYLLGTAYARVIGNAVYTDQDNKPKYGIFLDSDTHDNIVMCNYIEGWATSPLLDKGSNNVIKWNKGYITEKTGVAVLSGDGTATDFLIGKHGLTPIINDPTKAIVKCTPASPDAIAASPVACYLSDEDGDGVYESIRAKFASAPPSGTDNVKVVWEVEYIG